jgi:hypothetical protein
MVGSSTCFEGAINGRIGAEGGNQLHNCVSFATAEKADRYFLERIVERARDQFIVKEVLENRNCRGQIANCNPHMVKGKLIHRRSFLSFINMTKKLRECQFGIWHPFDTK